MFKNLDNMKYIDLFDVENSYNNITETELNRKDDLIICQNEQIIENANAQYKCCYYNTINDNCESDNYIILTYRENVTYDSGFVIKNEESSKIEKKDFLILDIVDPTEERTLNFYGELEEQKTLNIKFYSKNNEDFSPEAKKMFEKIVRSYNEQQL